MAMMLLINGLCTMMWFYLEGKSCICLFLFSAFTVFITFKTRNLRGVHPSMTIKSFTRSSKVFSHHYGTAKLDKKIRLFNEDHDL